MGRKGKPGSISRGLMITLRKTTALTGQTESELKKFIADQRKIAKRQGITGDQLVANTTRTFRALLTESQRETIFGNRELEHLDLRMARKKGKGG